MSSFYLSIVSSQFGSSYMEIFVYHLPEEHPCSRSLSASEIPEEERYSEFNMVAGECRSLVST